MVSGAVSTVNASTLDAASTGGVLTHRAWLNFLARNRKRRTITHVIGDLNSYLAVEGRIGRPGTNLYDPTLARIDPQATMINQGFGNNVQWFLTNFANDATQPGPVPAGQIWALDASQAIVHVTNTSAQYSASQEFVLRRSEVMRMDWSSEVYRMFGDTDLTPFDALVLA